MTLKDFLGYAHDRNIGDDKLGMYFKDMMHTSGYSYGNLDKKNQEFIFNTILKHRKSFLKDINISQSEAEHEFYNIWYERQSLGLDEKDLQNIKEVINSFVK